MEQNIKGIFGAGRMPAVQRPNATDLGKQCDSKVVNIFMRWLKFLGKCNRIVCYVYCMRPFQ